MVWRLPNIDGIFLEKAIPHNSKTLLQKKATEKWYRTVPVKNLSERSERIPAAANGLGNTLL